MTRPTPGRMQDISDKLYELGSVIIDEVFAEKIDALRAENQKLKDALSITRAGFDGAAIENQRLRAGLKKACETLRRAHQDIVSIKPRSKVTLYSDLDLVADELEKLMTEEKK